LDECLQQVLGTLGHLTSQFVEGGILGLEIGWSSRPSRQLIGDEDAVEVGY